MPRFVVSYFLKSKRKVYCSGYDAKNLDEAEDKFVRDHCVNDPQTAGSDSDVSSESPDMDPDVMDYCVHRVDELKYRR